MTRVLRSEDISKTLSIKPASTTGKGIYSTSRTNLPLREVLEQEGYNIDTDDLRSLSEALRRAVQNGNIQVVMLLLERGTEVNAKDDDGKTALHIAVEGSREDIARLLLRKGANPNEKIEMPLPNGVERKFNSRGKAYYYDWKTKQTNDESPVKETSRSAPLHLAKSLSLVQLLHKNNANVNAEDVKNQRPLHIAIREKNESVAVYLIENGANINAKDVDGKTALHLAVEKKLYQIVSTLLKAEADPLLLDYDNNTPKTLAWAQNDKSIVSLFNDPQFTPAYRESTGLSEEKADICKNFDGIFYSRMLETTYERTTYPGVWTMLYDQGFHGRFGDYETRWFHLPANNVCNHFTTPPSSADFRYSEYG